jgi:hypothetical protein
MHYVSFLFRSFLPTYCRCRRLLLQFNTLNHTHTHTHDRTPLEEGSARCRYHYMKTQSTNNREISMFPGGIQTRNPSKRAAAELCLRPRGHWDRPIIYIICVIRMIKSRRMRWTEVEKLNYVTLP